MGLHRYFTPVTSLPTPSGPLSVSLTPAAIRHANDAVRSVSEPSSSRHGKSRGTYSKISPEKQEVIGRYAAEHGNTAAMRYFSKQLKVDLKLSSVTTWKSKYINENEEES